MALELPQWGEAAQDPSKLVQLLDQFAINVANEFNKASPVGSISIYSKDSPPQGWLECNGAEFNRTKFPELFKVITDTWGGTATTFNLPSSGDLPVLADVDTIWMIRVE